MRFLQILPLKRLRKLLEQQYIKVITTIESCILQHDGIKENVFNKCIQSPKKYGGSHCLQLIEFDFNSLLGLHCKVIP